MASLTGASIASSYTSLLKLNGNTDSLVAGDGSNAIQVVDGDGTASNLYLNTNRVGIGNQPAYTLEVKASVSGDWLSRLYNTADASNPSGLLVRLDDADSTGILLGVNASGTYRLVVKPDGNVGIGVSDPDSELEIFHATDPQLKFSINTHGDAGLILCDADGMKLYGKGASDQMRFHCDTTEVMRIATNSLLIGKTTDATASANGISIQVHNGESESGQSPALFTKANAGHAINVFGESAGVEDCSHFKNASTAWGGATKGIIKMTDASAGASTTNFFYCEDSGGTEARLDTNGLYYGSGTAVSAIDYAEFFESKDGKAIPFGTSVKLDGDKIVPCSDGDTPIGVIRPNEGSSVLGGNSLQWHKKYKRTDYDAYETEDYEVCEWEITEVVQEAYTEEIEGKNEKGEVEILKIKHDEVTENKFVQYEKGKEPEGVEIPSDALVVKKTRRIVNPDWDSSKTYVERKDRDEWNLVGLLGQVPITKGQPVASNWIKMRDVSENVEMYLIK